MPPLRDASSAELTLSSQPLSGAGDMKGSEKMNVSSVVAGRDAGESV
jgi:hypothetical protein